MTTTELFLLFVLVHFAPVDAPKTSIFRSLSILLIATLFPLNLAVPLEWVRWNRPLQVAFTFDDGPHPHPTDLLCEVLANHQASATFFVVGQVAEKHPAVLRLLSNLGHEVSNHSWSHPDIRFTPTETLRRELDMTRSLIHSLTGQDTYSFRTPGGDEKFLRSKFSIPQGYQLVLWDVHSRDQTGLSAEKIAERVLSQVKDGDVVLMHNGLATTRRALDIILPALREKGFEFVTVSNLRRSRPHNEVSVRKPTFLQG